MSGKPQTIDEYLAPLSDEKRAALQKLRRAIKAAAPRAEECIRYNIPAFRLGGKMIVAFGAAANHCAFYAGSTPVELYRDELEAYGTSKGTIRFQADRPLPATLVRKLVNAQIAAKIVRPEGQKPR
jgi:uncharacterized protein YdhG (YjbR/CyaY superfamily)